MKLGVVELKVSEELERKHLAVLEYQLRRIGSGLWFVGFALIVAAVLVRTAVAAERK
jgi:hypothetical protein